MMPAQPCQRRGVLACEHAVRSPARIQVEATVRCMVRTCLAVPGNSTATSGAPLELGSAGVVIGITLPAASCIHSRRLQATASVPATLHDPYLLLVLDMSLSPRPRADREDSI